MRHLNKYFFLIIFFVLFSGYLKGQHRHVDQLKKTDRFGFTTMFYYTYQNWLEGDNRKKGSLKFDSFRIWAQTDVDKKFFGAVQYRFYEGWQTPQYMFVGYNVDENNTLQIGQTWVPFGIDYQPFDDWGNIAYYVGLQDDYDFGFVWTGTYSTFNINAGFFKNQQLSSSSPMRYDTDIYSGDNADYLIPMAKKNQEINQFNIRAEVTPSINNLMLAVGISGMAGQLYNETTDKNGSRYAAAVHAKIDAGFFHYNIQGTWYNYTQALYDTATQDMMDFINVSSWNFAYEIPVNANIITTSVAFDIIDKKLTIHANYSQLWGGTSQAYSQLITFGVRTLWDSFELYAEAYYGVNDPQLSGHSSGYGRDSGTYDLRFDIRFYYKLNILSKKTIDRFKTK